MTLQPTPTTVGAMYDEHTDLALEIMGGYIHVGYWPDPSKEETMEVAADRLTTEVGARLSPARGQRILDVGCGTGKATARLASEYEAQVHGISVSNHQVTLAQAQYGSGPVSFQVANAMDMPFADASFDGAYAIESLLHMGDKRTALTQIARVLRPGSRVVIADVVLNVSNRQPHPTTLIRYYQDFETSPLPSADDLRNLIHQSGLKVIEYTDIREQIRPTAKFFEEKGLALGGDLGAKAANIGYFLTHVEELGYALITAERV